MFHNFWLNITQYGNKIYIMNSVQLFLHLTNNTLCHEDVWGNGYWDPRFLDLSSSWRQVVSFTTQPIYSWRRAHGTHWIGGSVDPKASLDAEKKIFLTLMRLELQPLSQPSCGPLYRRHYSNSWDYQEGYENNVR